MTREDYLRIIRDSVTTSDVEGNPATFDPPEWALRAVQRAIDIGRQNGALVATDLAEFTRIEHRSVVAELNDALTVMLDSFGPQMDNGPRREYRALVDRVAKDVRS